MSWLGIKWRRRRAGRRELVTLLGGYRHAALLFVAAKLGLADHLAGGPRSSAELARSLGAHAPSLHRILRGLVALGVCSEEKDGRFRLAAIGSWLQSNKPDSLRGSAILCGEEHLGAWDGLLHSAMTGEPAFDRVFGMSVWEHRRQHPELDEYFNAGSVRGAARACEAILAAYDFSPFRVIADVGGGRGVLLSAILRGYPSAAGILFDQPHVVAGAQSQLETAGVAARCEPVGGSFFDRIPEGADALILKQVIHDWDDEQSLAILRNCHKALKEQGRLLLIEWLLPARVERDADAILSDLHMLALTGGRERSEGEYRALLAEAGFRLTRVITATSRLSIIEGVWAATP
jgi:SAM-dependent methyltransferase